jgi:hypothetical protein
VKLTSVQIPSKSALDDDVEGEEPVDRDHGSGASHGNEESDEEEDAGKEGAKHGEEKPTEGGNKDATKGTPSQGKATTPQGNPPKGAN